MNDRPTATVRQSREITDHWEACVKACALVGGPEHVGELVEAARKAVALNMHDDWCDECGDVQHTPTCVIAGLQAAFAKVKA